MNKQERFLKLYEPIHDRFERFCRARLYGHSSFMEHSDLMNDSLLIAYDKFDSLQSEEAFLSFLFGIAIRILSNHQKKKKEERFTSDNQMVMVASSSAPDLNAELHFLYKALNQLNLEQRESIILFEISGFSIKEIAVLHQPSESSVKQRLKRGREKLANILADNSINKEKEVQNG
jgi:RNA polymerase sigma-70 factor (ECF subfamily)